MSPSHVDDPSFDLGRHLVRATIGLRAVVGQRPETLGRVAHEPAVKRPAIDPVAGGGVFDSRPVQNLSYGVVALLNHRQIHQWQGALLGSTEHK